MAFEGLADKLQAAFQKLTSRGKLTEKDVKEAMREVRMALLEADVNYMVVKDFVKRVTDRAVGEEILSTSERRGRPVIKIVRRGNDRADGRNQAQAGIHRPTRPPSSCSCGLQGAGKTTHGGQARRDAARSRASARCSSRADVYRPAAIKQLQVVGSTGGRAGL